MAKLFANSGDPDETPHSAASDLGLHCFQITLLGSPDYNGLNRSHMTCRYFSLETNGRACLSIHWSHIS